MSATETPDVALTTTAPTFGLNWSVDQGESSFDEWSGERAKVKTKYDEIKAIAQAGGNGVTALEYRVNEGRARLVARYTGAGQGTQGYPNDVTVIEELYAVDVLKDILEAPYFTIELDSWHPLYALQDAAVKVLPLSDDQCAFVRAVSELGLSEGQIDEYVANEAGLSTGTHDWANWSTGMKELRYHLVRGVNTYYETGFVLRRSQHGVKTSNVQATFDNINTVGTAPTFDTQMDKLIESLPKDGSGAPIGEWLYKPPSAEHLGQGRWRVTQEWHYAEKWSIIYGGTWNYTAP